MAKLDGDAINAVRDGRAAEDAKLQALQHFVKHMLDTRGKTDDAEVRTFLDAGYSENQVLELMVGIAMKALSNTFSRFAKTELESINAKMEWAGNDRV